MFILNKEKNENDVIHSLKIDNPRFNIDDCRRIKAFIRFQINSIDTGDEDIHDINIIMKFGRCVEIFTIRGALYAMTLRVAGKENDVCYTFQTTYCENGKVDLKLLKKVSVEKFK